MTSEPMSGRRSDCPLSIALELFGDRWTLLILRDLLLKGFTTFKQFQHSGEGIATNILADRLRRLQNAALITGRRSVADGRTVEYRPTAKGLELLPVLIEMILWTARHERTAAPPGLLRRMHDDRAAFIAEIEARYLSCLPDTAALPAAGESGESP